MLSQITRFRDEHRFRFAAGGSTLEATADTLTGGARNSTYDKSSKRIQLSRSGGAVSSGKFCGEGCAVAKSCVRCHSAFVRRRKPRFVSNDPTSVVCRIGAIAAGSTRGQEPHRRQQRSGRQQHEPRHGRRRGDVGHRDKRACIPEKMQYENSFQKTRVCVCTVGARAALEATAACQPLCEMPRR